MRSWISGSSAARSGARSGPSPAIENIVPRSTRTTADSPQLCTMSVAFDDHGEIVPGRGTTSSCCGPDGASSSRGP